MSPGIDETRTTRWAGVSPSDRTAERRRLLVEAGFELLGAQGLAGVTVRGVCAGARLNARYFYESFPDLDALVVAVFERVVADLRTRVDAAIAEAGPEPLARIRATVVSTADFVDSDRRRARVLYEEGRGHEGLQRGRAAAALLIAELVATEAAGDAPGVTDRAVASFLVGGYSELLVRWLDGTVPVGRDELVDIATELFAVVGQVGRRLSGPGAER